VGNYCYVAVCSAALGASAATEGGEGRGHIVAAARLQLVLGCYDTIITFMIDDDDDDWLKDDDELCKPCVLMSEVDKCRRPGDLTVTYNPSFAASAGPSSPADDAAAAAAAGGGAGSTEDSVTSPGTCSTASSFSPQQSTFHPLSVPPSAASRDNHSAAPLHRPNSINGLCVPLSQLMLLILNPDVKSFIHSGFY